MTYFLALDQGTSSTRAMLYTKEGKLHSGSQQALTQYYPKAGWVEHCPEEIWQSTLKVMKDVIDQVDKKQILAFGLTNQRETTVIWNKKTGECLYNAIVWQDRRTQIQCDSLTEYSGLIHNKTGLIPDPYFSASKLQWLLENIPAAKKLSDKGELAFGTIDTFLIWRFTKGKYHLTDITNASRTLLFNIFTHQWDENLLDIFKINTSILPEVKASDGHFGFIDKQFFNQEIPIYGVAGDQQAALIGQSCFEKGMVKATFGTGGFLLMNTGEKAIVSNHRLLTTIAYQIKGKIVYGLEGSIYQAGTTIKWLRDELKMLETSAESEILAKSLASNEGVYLVPSFTGLGAPHWLNSAGALMVGLKRTTNRAHFARAALESVCYQTKEVLDCMKEDSKIRIPFLRVDGGMAENKWFLQYLASVCKIQVEKPSDVETTAMGAAMLAALGSGFIDSTTTLAKLWQSEKKFEPSKDKQFDKDYKGWVNALRLLKNS